MVGRQLRSSVAALVALSLLTACLQPVDVELHQDLPFCPTVGGDLGMDLYLPETDELPRPLVVFVHGGGWKSGDKKQLRTKWRETVSTALLREGYAVAAINYRLVPEDTWQDQVTDVRCAFDYLRSHAAEYQLDPERVGLWGSSAGGHLAALVGLSGGTTHPVAALGEHDPGIAPRAVVLVGAPTDLGAPDELPGLADRLPRLFGDDAKHAANPMTQPPIDPVPFLIVHGAEDEVVLPVQAERFHAWLRHHDVTAELLLVPDAGHSLDIAQNEENDLARRIVDYFDTHLRP